MEDTPSHPAVSHSAATAEASLEQEIDHLKTALLEHDRSVCDNLRGGDRPSLAEKKARSRIIRQLNRARRQLYRLRTEGAQQPTRKVTFRVSEDDYARLQVLAQDEGLPLSAYIRRRLFPDG
jgi:predicted DNA binding CopG/RHH family protein